VYDYSEWSMWYPGWVVLLGSAVHTSCVRLDDDEISISAAH